MKLIAKTKRNTHKKQTKQKQDKKQTKTKEKYISISCLPLTGRDK